VLATDDLPPHAILWASGRRFGVKKMFPVRLVHKHPSLPTLHLVRLSCGCQYNLPAQYSMHCVSTRVLPLTSSARINWAGCCSGRPGALHLCSGLHSLNLDWDRAICWLRLFWFSSVSFVKSWNRILKYAIVATFKSLFFVILFYFIT
jgi:hypothetical protein